eukprot:COSAG01_NODE_119_length_25410_cov_1333.312275_18_plen_96_part_00
MNDGNAARFSHTFGPEPLRKLRRVDRTGLVTIHRPEQLSHLRIAGGLRAHSEVCADDMKKLADVERAGSVVVVAGEKPLQPHRPCQHCAVPRDRY